MRHRSGSLGSEKYQFIAIKTQSGSIRLLSMGQIDLFNEYSKGRCVRKITLMKKINKNINPFIHPTPLHTQQVQQIWNHSFPSPRSVAITKLKNQLPEAGRRIFGFIPFWKVLAIYEKVFVRFELGSRCRFPTIITILP